MCVCVCVCIVSDRARVWRLERRGWRVWSRGSVPSSARRTVAEGEGVGEGKREMGVSGCVAMPKECSCRVWRFIFSTAADRHAA